MDASDIIGLSTWQRRQANSGEVHATVPFRVRTFSAGRRELLRFGERTTSIATDLNDAPGE